jgi:hypothetical protein
MMNNAAPSSEGLKFGRKKADERQRMESHAMLYADYFSDTHHVLKGILAPL